MYLCLLTLKWVVCWAKAMRCRKNSLRTKGGNSELAWQRKCFLAFVRCGWELFWHKLRDDTYLYWLLQAWFISCVLLYHLCMGKVAANFRIPYAHMARGNTDLHVYMSEYFPMISGQWMDEEGSFNHNEKIRRNRVKCLDLGNMEEWDKIDFWAGKVCTDSLGISIYGLFAFF